MCLNGRDCRAAWPPDCQRASLASCSEESLQWRLYKDALIGRAEHMKVCDFPKLALARSCPLDAREADEKEKRIEGEREMKKKKREKIYASVMKSSEEDEQEGVVVSLI